MKETGLMFKAPLVRSILSGQKTQTRRVLKNQRSYDLHKCPFGQPGDRIYVRETFVQGYQADPSTGDIRDWDDDGNEIPMTTWYRATDSGISWSDDDGWETNVPWKPAIHMPKALARIWLEVTGVRVERLQSISRADVAAEGVAITEPRQFAMYGSNAEQRENMRCAAAAYQFQELWESTGGDWAANPWVWVIDFKRIELAAAKEGAISANS